MQGSFDETSSENSENVADLFGLFRPKRTKTANRVLSILKCLFYFRFLTRHQLQALVASDESSAYSRKWVITLLGELRKAGYVVARQRYYPQKTPEGVIVQVPRQELAFTLAPDGARALAGFVSPPPRPQDVRRWEDRKDIEHELGVGEFIYSVVEGLKHHEDLSLSGLWNGYQVEKLLNEYCRYNQIGPRPSLRPDLALKLSSVHHKNDFALVVEWCTGSEPVRRKPKGQGARQRLSSDESKLRRSVDLVINEKTQQALESVFGVAHVWFLTVAPDAGRVRATLELFRERVRVPRALAARIHRRFLAMESRYVRPETVLDDFCCRYEYDPKRRWGEAAGGYSILDMIKGRFSKIRRRA